MSSKNDTFKEHIRELTIINDYERKNSLKLKQTSSEQTDELKRELHKMKFKFTILSDEKESLQQELDSFQKWTEVLNSRLLFLYLNEVFAGTEFLKISPPISIYLAPPQLSNFQENPTPHLTNRKISKF